MPINIRTLVGNIFKGTIDNIDKIIIILQLIVIVTIISVCWIPVKHSYLGMLTGGKVQAEEHKMEEKAEEHKVEEEKTEVVQEEGFTQMEEGEELNKPLNKAQTGYDQASFQDYYEYGHYPQWYADYPSNINILGDSVAGSFESYQTNKQGEFKQYHPSGLAKDVEINRSTSTWGSDKPDSEFLSEYQYGNFPVWYSDYPSNSMIYNVKDKECTGCQKMVEKPNKEDVQDYMRYNTWLADYPDGEHADSVYSKF